MENDRSKDFRYWLYPRGRKMSFLKALGNYKSTITQLMAFFLKVEKKTSMTCTQHNEECFFFYMLSHVSFHYPKTVNVTLTFFTNLYLGIGERLYFKSRLSKWSRSISVRIKFKFNIKWLIFYVDSSKKFQFEPIFKF